jgi:PilZ domain
MRARRFPLTLPILCRRAGEETWLEGVTVNISTSGVLFRTSEPLDVDTRVEMTIVLRESGARTGELRCDAHIVRIEAGDSTTPSFAAAFLRSNLRQRATEMGRDRS